MTHDLDPDVLRITACRLAELGAHEAVRFFGKVTVSRKADDTPVTEADQAGQEVILAELGRAYPSHAVLTEEEMTRPDRHAAAATSEYCWVIDPIDGTRNFGRGLGVWSTSVAVLRGGRPIAGAIYDATTGKVYSASAGSGAFCGAQPMILVDRPVDSDTTLAIASFRRREIPPVVRAWMDRYSFRNLGSLCLHLVWVAAGLLDVAYAAECKAWDIAAGGLLIEEAGGVVTDHQGRAIWPLDVVQYGREDTPIIAGSPQMHARLLGDLHDKAEPA